LPRFEIRWLTRWCPSGDLSDELIRDLSRLTHVDSALLRPIRACTWAESQAKVDGISWLEHVVLGRRFYWVENPEGLTQRDFEVLDQSGFRDSYLPCNITRDEAALTRVWRMLRQRTSAPVPGGAGSRLVCRRSAEVDARL
jgi:hypothetical protein